MSMMKRYLEDVTVAYMKKHPRVTWEQAIEIITGDPGMTMEEAEELLSETRSK